MTPEIKSPLTAEEKPNYIHLDVILLKNWGKLNKTRDIELMLSGIDEQMIFDCMIEYAAQHLAEKDKEIERLKYQRSKCECCKCPDCSGTSLIG